MYAGRWRKNCI